MAQALGFDFGTTNTVLATANGGTTHSMAFTSAAGTADSMRTALSFMKDPQLGAVGAEGRGGPRGDPAVHRQSRRVPLPAVDQDLCCERPLPGHPDLCQAPQLRRPDGSLRKAAAQLCGRQLVDGGQPYRHRPAGAFRRRQSRSGAGDRALQRGALAVRLSRKFTMSTSRWPPPSTSRRT